MELSLYAKHYCHCFTYIDSFNAHKHMAGFFVHTDTTLDGICPEFDDLKL